MLKLVGTAAATITYKQQTVTPASQHVRLAIPAPSGRNAHSKLSSAEAAVLAYLWNSKFLVEESQSEVFRLIGSYLGSTGVSVQAESCENAVEKVLQAAKARWKPGLLMTARLKEALNITKPGSRSAS